MTHRVVSEMAEVTINRREFMLAMGSATVALSSGSDVYASAGPGKGELPKPRIDSDAPLRIGMIGRTGHLGYVLDALDSVPKASIAAYAFEDGDWGFNTDGSRRGGGSSYNMDRQEAWVDRQPWAKSNPALYETYQEMLEKEQLDLAVVCLPYVRNAHAICAAAESGLNILSEKPVAVNRSDLNSVKQAVNSAGVRLGAMFAMRYAPPIYSVRQTVVRGEIGIPCLARAQKSYKWGDDRPWFYRDKEIYGSTILWVGIHAIDYLRWCMGFEVRKVSGFHSNLAHPGSPGTQDSAVVSMEFENGATGAVTMDYLRPETAPSHGDDRIRIAGAKGIVEALPEKNILELMTDEHGPREPAVQEPELPLFADFVGELRGQRECMIGPDEAVRVTEICIAATEAADSLQVLSV